MKKMLILGLGHLANFVCEENSNLKITGTIRNLEKKRSHNCEKIFFDLDSSEGLESISNNFDYVLINFPPSSLSIEFIKNLSDHFKLDTSFIFISSTSVYGRGTSDESSIRTGIARNAKALIELEDHFKSLKGRQVTLIRPAGLIDEVRSPAKTLARRTEVKDSQMPVNLVHTRDVARFILFVIENDLWNEEYNLVSSIHSSKKDFYTSEINRLGLSCPTWLVGKTPDKLVLSSKVSLTGFKFTYPKLLS